MLDEEYSLFKSVISITEERDKKSLEKALVAALSDFLTYDALILLRIPGNYDDDYLEAAVSIPESAISDKLALIPHAFGDQRVQRDDAITKCIDRRDIVAVEHNENTRTLFPVIVNNIVVGVLDIYNHGITTNKKKLIQGFLRIYSNFQSIINDNEHDTLTGLLNRKTFDAQLSNLLSDVSPRITSATSLPDRRNPELNKNHWVGILDIDHFKSINDNFGHIYGDEVLLLFSDLMKKSFRSNDLLFRYGGEEFVVVLTSSTESEAFQAFERFRHIIEKFNFPQVGRVTVSIGMVKTDSSEIPTTILDHGDQALYYSKEHGRNQVSNYHQLIASGKLKEQEIISDIELF